MGTADHSSDPAPAAARTRSDTRVQTVDVPEEDAMSEAATAIGGGTTPGVPET